jgi:preprotein translocase subunit SecG
MVWLRYFIYGLHFLVSVALVVLVISQTTKHEGLGGTIGGASSTGSFRGRPGFEEQLARYTGYVATAFMFLSLLVFMLVEKRWL